MPLSKPFAQKALACPVAAKWGHVWVIGTHIDLPLRDRAKGPQRPKEPVWTPFASLKPAGVQFIDCGNIHPADTGYPAPWPGANAAGTRKIKDLGLSAFAEISSSTRHAVEIWMQKRGITMFESNTG